MIPFVSIYDRGRNKEIMNRVEVQVHLFRYQNTNYMCEPKLTRYRPTSLFTNITQDAYLL